MSKSSVKEAVCRELTQHVTQLPDEHLANELPRIMEEQRSEEATRNRDRFLRMRAAGKDYWCVDGTKLFWLTELEAAERRTEASSMVPATIDYEDEGQECGTPWKKASVEDIEAMMEAGKGIMLHGC